MVEVVYQEGGWEELPDTLKEIGKSTFASSNLKEIEVNVKKIKEYTFYNCKDLVKVVLKEGVTTVEKEAFLCPNISTFIWPDSVKEVGKDVFDGCDKLHELAGSKDQEKVIEYLKKVTKSMTPLMKLCVYDGKLEDIKKILDENSELISKGVASNGRNALSYYSQFGSSPQVLKLLLEAHPDGLNIWDINWNFPYEYLVKNNSVTKLACLEAIIGDRSLGRDDALHETMMAAFRETNVKGLESAVEEFAKLTEEKEVQEKDRWGDMVTRTKTVPILDLFAWQQFLEIHHCNNPDPGWFAVELMLLFDATWTVLNQANFKTDDASKTITKNLKGAIQKYVSDINSERPNLLRELLTTVPPNKLQMLEATRIFRTQISSYMRSGIMYIYYFEFFLYEVFTAIFTRLSIKFKSSDNGTYDWDNIVIRDMTIAYFFLALYFLLRKLAQFQAMYKLDMQILLFQKKYIIKKNWFKDYWNYIDLVASGGTIVLLVFYFRMGPGPEYEHFASVIALFVWMKVLSFTKAFSQPIATFVLMMSTIFRDLVAVVIVLIIIVMFGHAFYLTLFLCYSFLVVIILLNVLIAVVSDAYDAVLVTSSELFWRTRLELVAEIATTFEWLLQQDVEA
ncbi:hypothetical protein TrVE_jg12519 [Triparma verrucosa]|uniref:Uncharacterized protein n=1 Tax=Triparma verrucosa TaxID=1606542 RepID=A0A9W7KU85_9STRA|nr:hypothetical protein TrVE_jg12519 [Triparma verrucosa]